MSGLSEDLDPDDDESVFHLDDAPDAESCIDASYNAAVPAGDLPTRALSAAAVFQEDAATGALLMRDLQLLDSASTPPPAVDVVGRVTRLSEDGDAVPDAPGDAGLLVRLSGVREWSVEYEELKVTVWVSTESADYKLLSPAPLYAPTWAVLQRKAALAARVLILLSEDPSISYKALVKQAMLCNKIPDAIQFRQEELLQYGSFLADQIANTEGLEQCKALDGLRDLLKKQEATSAAAAERERGDPNKRQRKATKVWEAEPSHSPRERPPRGGGGGGRGKGKASSQPGDAGEVDPNAPKPPQTAFMYYSKEARPKLIAEIEAAAAAAGVPPSFAELQRRISERWKASSADERAQYEAIAEADRERFAMECRARQAEMEAAANKGKRGPNKRKSLELAAAAAAAAAAAEADGASGAAVGATGIDGAVPAPPDGGGAAAASGVSSSPPPGRRHHLAGEQAAQE